MRASLTFDKNIKHFKIEKKRGEIMKKFLFISLYFIFSYLYAYNVKQYFDNYSHIKFKNYDIIYTQDTFFPDKPNEPMLPVKTIKIIIPYGKTYQDIQITTDSKIFSKHFNILPTPQNIPTNQELEENFRKSKTYTKNTYYPPKKYDIKGINFKNGVAILILNLYPFQYNPIKRTLIHNKLFKININFKPDNMIKAKELSKILKLDFLKKKLNKNDFLNYEALSSYQNKNSHSYFPKSSLVSSDSPYDFIIITNSTLQPYFEVLITQKQAMGLNAKIYTVEDIYSNYTGNDNAEKIRNFIIDAYSVWSSTNHPLQWVLLGGDSNIVPARAVKVYAYWSSTWNVRTFYTDNYYAGLDGDWNNDGDSIYGEGDDASKPSDLTEELGTNGEEADWLYEIAVGRASLEDSTEVNNWLNKTISYENANINSSEYLRTSTLIGEYLGSGAWGAECMNEISLYLTDFDHNKLYQKEGNYSKQNVIDAINNGTNIISHIGHGSYTRVCNIYDGDVDTLLTNTDYCLFYTQACYTTLFNLSCIAESFIEKEHGAYAFIGNSHYGFYSSYKQQGSSQLYQREFYDAVQNESIKRLGDANNDSKEDLVGMIQAAGTMRFSAFAISLLGDPNLQLKTDIANVTAEQISDSIIKITYSDSLGSDADIIGNYSVYQRDDVTNIAEISSISVSGNDIHLYLSNILAKGIPHEIKISNVSGIKNPTKRPIKSLYNIVELSINKPTIWNAENGPYYIYKDLVVNGSGLTINPGTILKFNTDTYAIVYNNGWIKATGNENDKVIFTSYNDSIRANTGDWDQIFIYRDAKTDSCIFDNCIIDYATTGIYLDSLATTSISNTIIRNCEESGIYSYFASPQIENVAVSNCENGFYFENSQISLSNIISYQNNNYGLYLMDNSDIFIKNSIIRENSLGEYYNDSSILNISYSDLQTPYPGDGNISMNPLFENTDNFTLSPFSPCIDAGNPTETDPDGTIIDMGITYFEQTSYLEKPENVSITLYDSVNISWESVQGAIFYNIYSSDNPFNTFLLSAEKIKSLSWNDSLSFDKKFYLIKAGNNRN